MPIKVFAAVVAMVLVLAYLGPVMFKLKDIALSVIILIGIAMMLVDLRQSFQSKDD